MASDGMTLYHLVPSRSCRVLWLINVSRGFMCFSTRRACCIEQKRLLIFVTLAQCPGRMLRSHLPMLVVSDSVDRVVLTTGTRPACQHCREGFPQRSGCARHGRVQESQPRRKVRVSHTPSRVLMHEMCVAVVSAVQKERRSRLDDANLIVIQVYISVRGARAQTVSLHFCTVMCRCCRIPVLKEGDATVYESAACLLWLLEQHGEPPIKANLIEAAGSRPSEDCMLHMCFHCGHPLAIRRV